jgi:hypothetical protein
MARAGGITDDERLSSRAVKDWVNSYRAILVKRDLDKGKSISGNIVQDLGCVEMVAVDEAECCQVKSGCYIFKSVLPIPKPLELNSKDALTFVGDVNKRRGWETTSQVGSYWDQYNKYTSDIEKYYYFNEHIYVTNMDFLKFINIQGVFEDPTQAATFSKCSGEPCYTDNSEYPISRWMAPVIMDMVMKSELNLYLSTSSDQDNDASGTNPPSGHINVGAQQARAAE